LDYKETTIEHPLTLLTALLLSPLTALHSGYNCQKFLCLKTPRQLFPPLENCGAMTTNDGN